MSQKTITVNNIKYIIKNKNDIIQNTILNGAQWNNDIVLLIGQWIRKFNLKHFLNIGSHIGTVALPLSRYFEKVTAIEPFPPSFTHFEEHLKLNNIKNIESYNYAMGEIESNVFFLDSDHERVKNNSGGIHAITEDDINRKRLSSHLHSKKYQIKMKKLDDLPIDKFDIMLIDVEGREFETIRGGKSKILKYTQIIILEIWNNSKRKFENLLTTKEQILKYLEDLNYDKVNQVNDNFIFFHKSFKN